MLYQAELRPPKHKWSGWWEPAGSAARTGVALSTATTFPNRPHASSGFSPPTSSGNEESPASHLARQGSQRLLDPGSGRPTWPTPEPPS